MTPIRVIEIAGPVCVDPVDGVRLCQVCQEAFACQASGQGVFLDFTGVQVITSSFLHAAVACLFANFTVDTVESRLKWLGVDEDDDKLIRFVLKTAERFYGADLAQRKAMTAASHRSIEE